MRVRKRDIRSATHGPPVKGMLPLRLLFLCVLAKATSEDEVLWTIEATVGHGDPSAPVSMPDEEEGVHDLETLATMELTLHDIHLDEDVIYSPDAAAFQSQLVSTIHNKIGKVSQALESFQGYLVHLNSGVDAGSYTRDSNLPTHPGPVPVPALPSTEMFPYVRSSEQCNTTTHFHCGDGTCLPLQHKCDGTTDCVDGADEKLCESTRALCGSKQWACLTGYQCISTYWRCDGGQDCGDGSDETDCGSHRCGISAFECSDTLNVEIHQCIPRGFRCDGEDDCLDSSDERGCVEAECSEAYFKCSSGDKCIHNYWRCDGATDCFDGSDEADCHTIIASCTSKQFECASHNECVPKEKVCDGAGDCHDLSDEAACPHIPSKRFPYVPKKQIQVSEDQKATTIVKSPGECQGRFLCATGGLCIPSEWRCDRDDDCPDSSDEVGCVQAVCRENYFRCTSGDKCVHSRWRCDGDYDCFDKSDEAECANVHVECSDHDFKCILHGECVSQSNVCDGVPDCSDASDEARCAVPATEVATTPSTGPPTATPPLSVGESTSQMNTCGPFERQCVSGQCVASSWWCDGEQDCSDGSDEHHCPKSACGSHQLNCASEAKCFPLSFKCDGQRDCSDGSDEEGCAKRACRKTEFTCQDTGRCLPLAWKCDGQRDCLDGDDEGRCPKVKRCDLQRGQFACRSDSKCLSFTKVCDGLSDCIDDSDEGGKCEELCTATMCSNGCFRTPSGPRCTCPNTTTLDDQGTTCVGGLPSPFVLVGRRDALEAFSLDGTWNLTVYEGKSTHSGVIKTAYDPVEDEVYWSVVEMAGVYKRDLIKQKPAQFVFDTDENVVEALAVDYLGRNMYIMDGMRQVLLACTLKDFICTTVLSNTTSSPRSLELDFMNRKMFWTDWKAGVVESSDLDGSRRLVLADNLMWPNALAIDPLHQRVYWMEASTNTLESVKYDGTDKKLYSSGTVQHVYAMDLWENQLYFTDWSNSTVYKCNLNNCDVKTPVTDALPGSPFGIKVVQPHLLEMHNPCKDQPCSHICLLSATTAKGYRCSCPIHLVLQKDYKTCAGPSNV